MSLLLWEQSRQRVIRKKHDSVVYNVSFEVEGVEEEGDIEA